MEFEIQYATRTELVATCAGVIVRIVDGHRTTIEDFDRFFALLDAHFTDVPLVGVIQITRQGTPKLDSEVRRHVAQLYDARADRLVGVMVLLGIGFWMSAFSRTLGTFNGLLRRNQMALEATVEAGCETLARELIGLNAAELTAACQQLARRM